MRIWIFLSAMSCAVSGTSLAGVITHELIPSAEADVSSGVVTPQLLWLHVRGSHAVPEIHTIIEFDLAGIDLDAPVTSATLSLIALGAERGSATDQSMNIRVHGYAGDNQATEEDDSVNNPIAGPYHMEWRNEPRWPNLSAIDVTSHVQSLLTGDAVAAGFVLKPENYVGGSWLTLLITAAPNGFATSDYPRLTIVQSPEPACGFALVLAAFLPCRWRVARSGLVTGCARQKPPRCRPMRCYALPDQLKR